MCLFVYSFTYLLLKIVTQLLTIYPVAYILFYLPIDMSYIGLLNHYFTF